MIHERVESLRRKDRVDQIGQLAVVESENLGMAEQTLEPLDAVAPGRSRDNRQHAQIDAAMAVSLVQDRVQIVRDQHEAMVLGAAVHEVVVSDAQVQPGLVVQQERIDRDVSQPLPKVDDLADLLAGRWLPARC